MITVSLTTVFDAALGAISQGIWGTETDPLSTFFDAAANANYDGD